MSDEATQPSKKSESEKRPQYGQTKNRSHTEAAPLTY